MDGPFLRHGILHVPSCFVPVNHRIGPLKVVSNDHSLGVIPAYPTKDVHHRLQLPSQQMVKDTDDLPIENTDPLPLQNS